MWYVGLARENFCDVTKSLASGISGINLIKPVMFNYRAKMQTRYNMRVPRISLICVFIN